MFGHRIYNIPAKPTTYNGTRFRSRLEARWAVFFDELGIYYEYEPGQFTLDKQLYTPDFYLPQIDRFVEIKPTDAHPPEEYRCMELAVVTQTPVLIFAGSVPGDADLWVCYGMWGSVATRDAWLPMVGPDLVEGEFTESVYPYQDKDGKLLYEVLRFDIAPRRKRFVTRRPIAWNREMPEDSFGPYWDKMQQWCICPTCARIGIEFEGRFGRFCKEHSNDDHSSTSGDQRIVAAYASASRRRF